MADPLTLGLMVASTALSAMGSLAAGNAADANAKAQQVQLNYQAEQKEQAAGQELASSQRTAIEDRRQAELSSSRARAIVASSGGSLLDPSVIDIMGDIEAEGEYNAGISLYEGKERAASLEHGAELDRYEGRQARTAGKSAKRSSYFKAGTTVLAGASSMAGGFENMAGQSSGFNPAVSAPARKPTRYF